MNSEVNRIMMNGICNTQGKGSFNVPTVRQSVKDHYLLLYTKNLNII